MLALASNPTYEPSVYVSRDPSKLAPLQNTKVAAAKNYPGLDRAIDGLLPARLGLEAGDRARGDGGGDPLADRDASTARRASLFFRQIFTNWDPYVDQPMELTQALAESCDTYFYRVGASFYSLDSNRGPTLQLWASRFGFGEKTGIDIGPEAPGLLPTPEWRRKAFSGPKYSEIDRTWKPGY